MAATRGGRRARRRFPNVRGSVVKTLNFDSTDTTSVIGDIDECSPNLDGETTSPESSSSDRSTSSDSTSRPVSPNSNSDTPPLTSPKDSSIVIRDGLRLPPLLSLQNDDELKKWKRIFLHVINLQRQKIKSSSEAWYSRWFSPDRTSKKINAIDQILKDLPKADTLTELNKIFGDFINISDVVAARSYVGFSASAVHQAFKSLSVSTTHQAFQSLSVNYYQAELLRLLTVERDEISILSSGAYLPKPQGFLASLFYPMDPHRTQAKIDAINVTLREGSQLKNATLNSLNQFVDRLLERTDLCQHHTDGLHLWDSQAKQNLVDLSQKIKQAVIYVEGVVKQMETVPNLSYVSLSSTASVAAASSDVSHAAVPYPGLVQKPDVNGTIFRSHI